MPGPAVASSRNGPAAAQRAPAASSKRHSATVTESAPEAPCLGSGGLAPGRVHETPSSTVSAMPSAIASQKLPSRLDSDQARYAPIM